jgi:hypothetical protein
MWNRVIEGMERDADTHPPLSPLVASVLTQNAKRTPLINYRLLASPFTGEADTGNLPDRGAAS